LEESLSLQLPPSNYRIATAITNQELEVKVVTIAQANNWQIIKRAVDVADIDLSEINYLFISSDQPQLNFNGQTIVLSGTETNEAISELVTRPVENLKSNFTLNAGTGKNLILRSISGGTGCSTLAINLAFELAELGSQIHLVDFDANPVIAPYLGLRDLMKNPVKLLTNLQVSQANFSDLDTYRKFVQTQIDIGFTTIFDVGSNHKDFISGTNIYLSRIDLSNYSRIQNRLNRREFPEGSWLILNQKSNSIHQKRLEVQFLEMSENSAFKNVRTLPLDNKAFDVAQESNSALIESAKGSSIRRAIRDLAQELIK
jgi:Flp pilus assembly CpaE family ATPase